MPGVSKGVSCSNSFLASGLVSEHQERQLIDHLFEHVRAACLVLQGLLVCTDGFAAYLKSIARAFRDKVKTQADRGRYRLETWPDLCIATIIRHTKKKQVVEITRKVERGICEKAQELLASTPKCTQLNTAFMNA